MVLLFTRRMATQACPYLYFDDVVKAIDWFNKVAQFETLTRVDDSDGRVKHVELSLGPVVIMLGDPGKGNLSEHGNSQTLVLNTSSRNRVWQLACLMRVHYIVQGSAQAVCIL